MEPINIGGFKDRKLSFNRLCQRTILVLAPMSAAVEEKADTASLDLEKARRREPAQAHKKKLSKADEEMEVLEEMKRMNQMLLDEDARRSKDFRAFQEGKGPEDSTKEEVSQRLADALQRNANELDIESKPVAVPQTLPDTINTPAASASSYRAKHAILLYLGS